MKKIVSAMLILGTTVVQAEVPVADRQAQTAKSINAVTASTVFLSILLKTPREEVRVIGSPSLKGEAALIDMDVSGQQCRVELIERPLANKYGWQVTQHKCKKQS